MVLTSISTGTSSVNVEIQNRSHPSRDAEPSIRVLLSLMGVCYGILGLGYAHRREISRTSGGVFAKGIHPPVSNEAPGRQL